MSKTVMPDDPETKQQILDTQAHMVEQLASVVGIDVNKAIKCMSGQTKLYLKLVKDFTKDHQQRSEELLMLYATTDWEVLCRRVHSLKTFAAYIGAYELSQNASDMEDQMGKGQNNKSLLFNICKQIDALVPQLNQLYEEPVIEPVAVVFCVNELTQLLQRILPMLQQSELAVEDDMPALVQLCQSSEYAEASQTIAQYVDDIEFEKATELAKEILQQLT